MRYIKEAELRSRLIKTIGDKVIVILDFWQNQGKPRRFCRKRAT
jgi:hypothetical protein